jgi:heme/copper-type cytochrome/quinol oxidase subunit 1
MSGMPRRIPDYPDAYYFLNMVSSAGSAITIVSIIVFVEVINQLIYKRDKENGI